MLRHTLAVSLSLPESNVCFHVKCLFVVAPQPGIMHIEGIPDDDRCPATYEPLITRHGFESKLDHIADPLGDAGLVGLESILKRHLAKASLLAVALSAAQKALKTTEDCLQDSGYLCLDARSLVLTK